MVEREAGQLVEGEPAHSLGVVCGLWFDLSRVHLRQIYHGYRPAPGVSSGISTGIQLLNIRDVNSRFFAQFSPRGIVEPLILVDETPWHRPTSGEWVILTTN